MRRRSMTRKKSKKLFSKTASKTNARNLTNMPMRGGWRL